MEEIANNHRLDGAKTMYIMVDFNYRSLNWLPHRQSTWHSPQKLGYHSACIYQYMVTVSDFLNHQQYDLKMNVRDV